MYLVLILNTTLLPYLNHYHVARIDITFELHMHCMEVPNKPNVSPSVSQLTVTYFRFHHRLIYNVMEKPVVQLFFILGAIAPKC